MLFDPRKPASIVRAKAAIVWLRLLVSLAWLDSALIGPDAKFAPAFLDGSDLAHRVHTTFAHSAVSPEISHFLTTVVVEHAALFAWLIALADLSVGVSLLLGLFTRLGSTIAIVRAITNLLVAAGLGADTVNFNLTLIAVSVLLIVTAAGRTFGIDSMLIDRFPRARLLRIIG